MNADSAASGRVVSSNSRPAADAVVSARKLTRTFTGKKYSITALSGLNLDVPTGKMTAFVGPDGAGKTTFLRMICGLLEPSSGTLHVLGRDTVRQAREIQDLISYMPQRFGLYEDLSVRENMNLYADVHGIPEEIREKRFRRLLDMTDLSRFTDRLAGKLSGGMKQKLALACTLVRSPKLLLLDEPSVGVDPLSRRELWSIITDMVAEEHLSVIVSTAYMDEAERCDQVFVLHEGRIQAQGSPSELRSLTDGLCHTAAVPAGLRARQFQAWLLDRTDIVMDAVPEGDRVRFVLTPGCGKKAGVPETLFTSSLHGFHLKKEQCIAVPSRLEDSFMLLLKRGLSRENVKTKTSGEEADAPARQERRSLFLSPENRNEEKAQLMGNRRKEENETIIEVRDLVRRFGDFTAVSSTSFTVKRGEVFGLLGPNGAGKTTTFRMLCGLLPATSGHLRVAGENLRKAAAQARTRIGYVSQKFSLYGNLSVAENLHFFGGVYGMASSTLDRRIREVLEQFDLTGHENDLSGTLPGGFKQRLAMAVGLLHAPEILFLDEPTSGIDPLARRTFWRRITSLSEERTTIIITTHFMEEAEYCDRMLIQDAGKVLALGTPSEVRVQGGNADSMEEAFIHIVKQARSTQEKEKGA